jgi:hypothetical protein
VFFVSLPVRKEPCQGKEKGLKETKGIGSFTKNSIVERPFF